MSTLLEPEQPESDIHPELQINISHEAMERAADSYDRWNDSRMEIAQQVIATALATPPTVTEQTLETLVRALLATYPDHRWGEIKLRQMVGGLLLSLGVVIEG